MPTRGREPRRLQKDHSSRRTAVARQAGRQHAPDGSRSRISNLEKKTGHGVGRDDLLSYLLYPEVFLKYDKFRQTYSDVSVPPTPAFFYGLKSGEEITVEIESGKTSITKFLTVSDPHPDGTRTLFFELNGQPREVNVRDRALRVVERATPRPIQPNQARSRRPHGGCGFEHCGASQS